MLLTIFVVISFLSYNILGEFCILADSQGTYSSYFELTKISFLNQLKHGL